MRNLRLQPVADKPARAERIAVRPCGAGFAFVSVRCDGWSITGIRVRDVGGAARIEWPFAEAGGVRRPVCTPPPGLREELEAEIAAAVRRATGRRP